jgi:phosphopantothenoylcysteine decarboxylase
MPTTVEGRKILLGLTGSVASLKAHLLLHLYQSHGAILRVVCTQRALHFIPKEYLHEGRKFDRNFDAEFSIILSESDAPISVYTDSDEWDSWERRGDPVLHIELMRWADVFVIAPLDANTLSKIAYGLCDNLLTSVMRAFDQSKPVLLCPAMNKHMWCHPTTKRSLDLILSSSPRVEVMEPVEKTLICGDTGKVFQFEDRLHTRTF